MFNNFKIIGRIIKMAVMSNMMYRADLLLSWIFGAAYSIVMILSIKFMFDVSNLAIIAGFTQYQIYFVFLLLQIIWMLAFVFGLDSLFELSRIVRFGKLDIYLLKPFSAFWQIFFKQVGAKDGISLIVFFAIILPVVVLKMDPLTVTQWLLVVLFFIFSTVIFYAWMAISLMTEFFVENFGGLWQLFDGMGEISKFPRNIYPKLIQKVLIYILPVFLIASPIYEILINRISWKFVVGYLALTIFWVVVAIGLWNIGLRRYRSVA